MQSQIISAARSVLVLPAKCVALLLLVYLLISMPSFKWQGFAAHEPAGSTTGRILFGVGPEADGAVRSRLVGEAPVRMLSSWYNGPSDLTWMTEWAHELVPELYSKGYALHLITWSGDPEIALDTAYGPACGRTYPLSPRFVADMAALARTFAGTGPFYVTLFTEFQTYPCIDNQWLGSENYYRALKDQYRSAVATMHQIAPNARISLGWGGWQARWDDPSTGGGRSLFQYFDDVMRQSSDFQSFQAMQSDGNADDVRVMVGILGKYGPVMQAHYRPDSGSVTVTVKDLRIMLTDTYIDEVARDGLFAWSFMDSDIIDTPDSLYQLVKNGIVQYGTSPYLIPYRTGIPALVTGTGRAS